MPHDACPPVDSDLDEEMDLDEVEEFLIQEAGDESVPNDIVDDPPAVVDDGGGDVGGEDVDADGQIELHRDESVPNVIVDDPPAVVDDGGGDVGGEDVDADGQIELHLDGITRQPANKVSHDCKVMFADAAHGSHLG